MARRASKPKSRKPRSKLPFKRTDVVRAVRGAQDAKLAVERVDVDPASGKISVTIKSDVPQQRNTWDDVTDAEDAKRST
jgi:hypothetical protein